MRTKPDQLASPLGMWLALLLAMLAPALACNLPGQAQPTEVLFPSTRTPISTNTHGPSATLIPPSATFPMPSLTVSPTPTYQPGFQEPFDAVVQNWLDWYTLTTRAAGGNLKTGFKQANGMLTVTLADQETYLYRFYKLPQPADSFIETEFRMDGQKENQVALVCRAAQDQSAWYEARISGTGVFQIYSYSRARKTQEDLNPFVPLAQGAASAGAFDAGQFNLVRLTCQGNRLSLNFNQGRQVIDVEDDRLRSDGLLGIGVMAYGNPDTIIQFDEVNGGKP